MSSKPLIYVSRITNLSDARYCAGMGVDMLGFVVDPAHGDYVSPGDYQQMIGWVAGPKRVAELASVVSKDLVELIDNYKPDLLHVSMDALGNVKSSGLPIILEVPFGEWLSTPNKFLQIPASVQYLLLTKLPENIKDISSMPESSYSLLLSLDSTATSISLLLQKTKASGFSLQGSKELTPGLKDYDHLSRILEELEE